MKIAPLIPSVLLLLLPFTAVAADAHAPGFITEMAGFPALEEARGLTDIWEKLAFRAEQQPFLLAATVIFILAICHTFFAVPITRLSHKIRHDHEAAIRRERASKGDTTGAGDLVSFKATMLHFLGEVEAIFGIWVLALLGAMFAFHDLATVKGYIMGVNFTEPLFVVVIMALASTRPILRFAEACLGFFARFGRQSPAAWWLSIMIVAPLLGSLITEPGAMTIAAMLLAKKFYQLKPSPAFAYATLGLLFVNISVGGVLTNFAAPPVLMVAEKWGLTTLEMLTHYGDKAVVSILVSSGLCFACFRKELAAMRGRAGDHDGDGAGDLIQEERRVPVFITLTHLAFMAWTVAFSHYPPLFIGGFLFFLAFSQATAHHQTRINLRGPILVGFFLGGLVIHGGLQGWWLAPIISSLGEWPLFLGSTILTSFNDNAAITFLASQVDGLSPQLKYAVLAGAVSGGGLTVIANAPNPAGQALLGRFFGEGVSPLKLALGALIPTIIVALCMMFMPDRGVDKMFAPVENASATPPSHP
ncbi:putative Na+/H+ antiporter [Luteolibacter yonseiensis]|uniref:Na+/H+ antiporter n=1 Tax=Luteolibacter yonseiensis TaxID=1144680 RepID=A0A934V9X6_9BACT|nr:putative Na+/H+ antiporter [Luteolibacter yonseiensis]MBK1815618.1 putative Na+/H+ antiporter [Luteolibacter yonseiensis]